MTVTKAESMQQLMSAGEGVVDGYSFSDICLSISSWKSCKYGKTSFWI